VPALCRAVNTRSVAFYRERKAGQPPILPVWMNAIGHLIRTINLAME
jgi:hypothetical protein